MVKPLKREKPLNKEGVLKRAWSSRKSYLFVAPYMILFFIFTVLPVLFAIALSFTSFNVLEDPEWIGMGNYFRLFFEDSVFLIGVKNTLFLAVILGPCGYIFSLVCAWFINELSPKPRALVTLVFYAPSISGNVYLIWSVMFSGDQYGYVNSLLTKMGIIQKPIQFLQDTKYILPIVIIVSLWISLGTGFLSLIAAFQGIDKTYYEAGSIDGIRNRWQELWFITLPLIRPQMLFSAVMSITSAFNVGAVITALCGYPTTDYAGHTIMNHLTDYGLERFEMGYASSIAVVLFCMMIGANLLAKHMIAKVGE